MDREQVCRTCGRKFRPPPGKKRGYIDECGDCASERLEPRPATRAGPVCEYCRLPVLQAGDVHHSCIEGENHFFLSLAKIPGLPPLLRERPKGHTRHLRGPETVTFTRDEFDELVRLQKRRRWDWPAVFSTNEYGDIWPWTTYGWTPDSEREQLRGISRIIDAVAEIYRLKARPEGGRFFIDDNGAFYKNEEGSQVIQFVIFQMQGSAVRYAD